MNNRGTFGKILATAGTILVWLPILAPTLMTIIRLLQQGGFNFDYLMPAELFLLALVGGGSLILVARRSGLRWRLVGWGLGIAAGMLGAGQLVAIVTGLASGEAQAAGWPLALVRATIYIYILALVVTGIGAILLLRRLFRLRITEKPSKQSHS